MRKLLAVLATVAMFGCNSKPAWDASFKDTYHHQFVMICLNNGIPLDASQDIAKCIINKAEKAYTQAEFLMLDANVAGQRVGQQLAIDCMCKNSITRAKVAASVGCP